MIRKSSPDDIPSILELIDEARKKMVAEGNIHQWADGHPSRQQIEDDVERGVSYMMEEEGEAVATFALIEGPDPTYAVIYDGQWLNDRPYYVIHRVASGHKAHGVMRRVLDYAFTLTDTVRIDTHADNKTMQGLLRKYGFAYCGIIHLANGDPRLAFQKTITSKEK
ncbi:MAG: N-acetyltransferase [Bacteroidales bacterium]|nr:N-acetyltransferase [Bacteroidales bacterium]